MKQATARRPDLDRLIASTGARIVGREVIPASAGESVPVPGGLPSALHDALASTGIRHLHAHQRDAVAAVIRGEHVLLTTGTASGKSLAYQLPALGQQLRDPHATMLALFPTKALAHDQARAFGRLSRAAGLPETAVASYDGDTPSGRRPSIRANVRSLITNPDMLHAGLLPHHTLWRRFLQGLSLVVVDELHTYRGVFGSHVAGALRRLRRLARHYGSHPTFVLTSATLGNPTEHAFRLTGAEVRHVQHDTAPHSERTTLLVQPPLVDEDLGMRRPALQEAMSITRSLVGAGQQVLLFAGTRQATEEAVLGLKGSVPGVRAYRSGLLPAERRQIEAELRDGTARAVVSTNALELGIDIGGMDAVVMAGYPGSAAAFRQQAGRAGRRDGPGTTVLVLGAGPLDQYLAVNPGHLFGATSERVLCEPDHLLIALDHLRCAAFESPVAEGEEYGGLSADDVALLMGQLREEGTVHGAAGRWYFVGQEYPAQGVSLRTTSGTTVSLQEDGETIGSVDFDSAHWLVHEGAVYLHDGQPFVVNFLDTAAGIARLERTDDRFITRANREIRIDPAGEVRYASVRGARKLLADVVVSDRVTGYRRMLRQTHEVLARFPLDSEPVTLFTAAYGFTPDESVVNRLREAGSWSNDTNDYGPDWPAIRRAVVERDGRRCRLCGTSSATGTLLQVHHKVPFREFADAKSANDPDNLITLCPACHRRAEQGVMIRSGLAATAHLLRALAPLLVMCDGRDLGVHSDPASPVTGGAPVIVIYETVPGGVGLARELADRHDSLVFAALDLVTGCSCSDGCPACVGPAGEPGHAGKAEAIALLKELT